MKKSLKDHFKDSKIHTDATVFAEKREKDQEHTQQVSVKAGLTVGRYAYATLYRGRPYSDFPMEILLASKGGAVTGDINHSKQFLKEFRKSCSTLLVQKLKNYLSIPLPSTGRRPPIAFSCDKMTEKRRSGQMTAIATIIPKPEVPPDEMMQTFFVGNPVVRNHTAAGLLPQSC